MSVDYKSTVFLPKTDFPMKAGLPQKEPEILARWQEMDLYRRLRDSAKGRDKFVLHDGPPYANGHLHIGHALNKILKDIINRSQQMMGKDADYVPGWDCHGLPIEWKIEEKYRAEGRDKDSVDPIEFRQECRAFAAKWLDVQRDEFKRLGIEGNWQKPYTTMAYDAEAQIVAELGKFLMNGSLYRGAKPVMWSVVEKTALAEAEVEYHDHASVTIWVKFPVVKASHPAIENSAIVIWTTTPWTMPGNRAIAYGEEIDYAVYEVQELAEGALPRIGERIVVAKALADQVMGEAKITKFSEIASLSGRELMGTICHHPLHGQGYDFDVPLLPGDHVTTEAGTGFVHTAPGHGEEDFAVGRKFGLAVPDTVQADGTFFDHVPLFAGMQVVAQGKDGKYYSPVAKPVREALQAAGNLLHFGKLVHSYPHSWRSKAPLIYRTTPQWFVSMETNGLRETALKAISETQFVPPQSRNRLGAMVENRPDWCLSRQRAWGVPITVFVRKGSGEVLRDQAVIDRIVAAVRQDGADAWFNSPAERFLGDAYDAADYEQVFDILDVWFDSGSTHSFVLENGDWGLQSPADLYLEGSDQHRGWFQSSLLESCGTRGRAPYKAVLTHGFTLDEQGRKMSKSLGNTVAPQDVVDQSGADILRVWVAGTDYTEDQRIGPEILKTNVDIYRRLRNTLRYMLGSLEGFDESERIGHAQMPELERWVLHRLWQLDGAMRKGYTGYQFHQAFAELHHFCAVDLSAFYFDIRKDSLYCDRVTDPRRRATRTVLDILFNCLTTWLAPILCFTAEEAFWARRGNQQDSIHLQLFPNIPAEWRDDALAEKWEQVREVRRVVTGALEIERAQKRIGSSLGAKPRVFVTEAHAKALDGVDLAEVAITSGIEVQVADVPEGAFTVEGISGIGVLPEAAEGERCERCWKVLPEVGSHHGHPAVCNRCADAVDHQLASA